MLWATAGSCGGEDGASPVARNRIVGRTVEVPRTMRPLRLAPDADTAPDTGLRRADDVTVDARVLVITADGTEASADAIIETLRYLGTPFDVLNASTGPTLTPDVLATADHGRYYGVVLDDGDLGAGDQSAFTDEEWMTLASYEARFGVRRAVMYAYPTDDLRADIDRRLRRLDPKPIIARCTPAGGAVFVGANCAVPLFVDNGWAYGSQPTDAATVPLLVDDAGSVYAATRDYPDGREALVLTFAQSPTALHTLQLGLRRRQLGDARAVRGRAPRLPGAADRRLLPGEPDLSDGGGHVPHDRRRSAGVHQLAGRAARRAADRAVPRGVRVQRLRREAAQAATA